MTKHSLFFGCDHAGYELKMRIIKLIDDGVHFKNVECKDIVCDENNADYPNVAFEVCSNVMRNGGFGVLICSTGLGMAIAANKMPAIRAVTCSDSYSSSIARAHNDANILCLGGKILGAELAFAIVSAFVLTPFEKGNHLRCINIIRELENNTFKI